MHTPTIGDWVNSYTEGIWQVYRIIDGVNELRYSLDDKKKRSRRVIVFSKRLVDTYWKPAFAVESCERSMATAVTTDCIDQIDTFLAEHPNVKSAFESYTPEPIDLIVNLSMAVRDRSRLITFCETTLADETAQGVPLDRVLSLIQQTGLSQYIGKTPINTTLQLTCRDHEMKDGEFILRDARVLPF